MCGRYFIAEDDGSAFGSILREVREKYPNVRVKTGEIFPTDTAPILLAHNGEVAPQPAAWGFPNFKGSGVIINAKSETAAEKRMFSESLAARRCVVPTSGFYEWSQDANKQKYLFQLPETTLLYLAGLYRDYEGVRRYVILTAAANESVSDVHSRMPVILNPGSAGDWLTDTDYALNLLSRPLPRLLRSAAR